MADGAGEAQPVRGGHHGRGRRSTTPSSASPHVSSTGSQSTMGGPVVATTPPTPPTPATPATAATHVSCAQYGGVPFEPGTTDPTDRRIWIRPAALTPHQHLQRLLRSCTRANMTSHGPHGQKWTRMFVTCGLGNLEWLPSDGKAIRKAFESRGGRPVKNAMNKIRSGEDKGDQLFPHVLEGLRKYWAEDPKFLQKSAIGKQNRAKDPAAPRYTGDSRSICSHFNKLKQKFQRDPTAYEVMEVTKKTKTGAWVNEKSAGVADAFYCLREEANSQGQVHSAASDNALFLKAAGGKNKKEYVYGLGPMGDDFVASSMPHI